MQNNIVLAAALSSAVFPAVTGHSASVHVLHSFGARNDGINPLAGLIEVDSVFYGTTYEGGASSCNCGTIYQVTKDGTETVLYSFTGSNDGAFAYSNLTYANGLLYGATSYGGQYGSGVIYSIPPGGTTPTTVHSFSGADGYLPAGRLVSMGGLLYGVTNAGGANNKGVVFSIDGNGTYSVLYSFGATKTDGASPNGGLLASGGLLFGTTTAGGANKIGTIYSLTPTGTETVLYSFDKTSGYFPESNLVSLGSYLYGTTENGGACAYCGTIFRITPGGAFGLVYKFKKNGTKGDGPFGDLTIANNTVYGTTGGSVFSVSAAGKYSFIANITEGEAYGGLAYDGGVLYGTTYQGGQYNDGTVFSTNP